MSKKMNKQVFSIHAEDITEKMTFEDEHTVISYDTEEEAIQAAIDVAYILSISYPQVFCVTAYIDGYIDRWGNVEGEPVEIYTVSSKSVGETMRARRMAGYVSLEVDEYTNVVPKSNNNMQSDTIVIANLVTCDEDGNLTIDIMRFSSVEDAMVAGEEESEKWMNRHPFHTLDEDDAIQRGHHLCVKNVMGNWIEITCMDDKSEFNFYVKEFEI